MDILYVGIDVGNKNSQLFGFTEAGEVKEERLSTLSEWAWREMFGQWSKGFEVRACFEAGPHYEWLYDLLCEFCEQVVMVDPGSFAMISKSQKKTDKIDARKLAEGLRRGDLPEVYVPEKRIRADRRLTHFLRWHSRKLAGIKGRVRSLLVTYRLACPYGNVLGKKAQAWLQKEGRAGMDEQGRIFLEVLLDEARSAQRHHKELLALLPERLKAYGEAAERVDSIPGFGPLVTLAVLSAIACVGRFKRPGELASYFGVCGRVFQSGNTLKLGSITKRGNKTVRWLLSQALTHLHRKDPKARMRYQKLKRKKPKGVARGAQVRWLTNIIWHLLTKREEYRMASTKTKVA
jgi:transposase